MMNYAALKRLCVPYCSGDILIFYGHCVFVSVSDLSTLPLALNNSYLWQFGFRNSTLLLTTVVDELYLY